MKILKSIVAASLLVSSAMAIQPMQKEAGWSGFVLLGAGGINFKNNEIAGNRVVDVKDKQINDYGAAESQSAAIPIISGTVRYTLENKKTEFFFGNSLEDYLRMDATVGLGVRHSFDKVGILGIRLLASSTPTEVWEDPFVKDRDRTDTERTSSGLGLKWEGIMGSNFELDLRGRTMEFEDDFNGQSLVAGGGNNVGDAAGEGARYITQAQQKLLEREGTVGSLELLYTWKLNDNNLIVPSIKGTTSDRDGDARDYSQSEIKIGHLFFNSSWIIASNLFASTTEFDEKNPIFDEYQDGTTVGGGINVTYKKPFGWENWNLNTGIVAVQSDSDIDFYDSSLVIATFGFAYVF